MFRAGGNNPITIDISELDGLIRDMRKIHTKQEYEQLMLRAFRRTGTRVKTILGKEIPKEYEAKSTWIKSNVGRPRTGFGGGNGASVSCSIPIDGARGVHGWQFRTSKPRGRPAKGRRYKIATHMIKGQTGELPPVMKNQGGNPPFIGPNGIVFTRKTDKRLPIVRVAGIGIPQMPINRSEDDIQEEIIDTLKKRIEHEHNYLISNLGR